MLAVINGLRTVGALGEEYFKNENTKNFIMTLEAGNTTEQRGAVPLLSFMDARTNTVERVAGQTIPVEIFKVFFTEGGFTSNGYGFDKYVEQFEIPREEGLTAVTYNWSQEEILEARENRIDLFKKVMEQTTKYVVKYQNSVLPYRRIQTLLTGSSLSAKVPTEAVANSDDNYVRAFGWLRGEDVTDWLKAHLVKGNGHRCHYRGTKGASFTYADINETVDLLHSYEDASSQKPFALANNRTIQNTIASSLEYAQNKDDVIVFGEQEKQLKYRSALGCNWIDVDSYLPDGIILFVDAEATDLFIKTISPDPEQRGIAFVKEFADQQFKLESAEDFKGGKVQVFPEELLIAKRHLGAILDTEVQGQTAEGKEGWAKDETIEKIETFAKAMRDSYIKPMK